MTKQKRTYKKHFTEAVLSKSFVPHYPLIEKHDLVYVFAAPSFKQSDFAIAIQRMLIVTYFSVVPEWKARKM